MDIEQKSLVWTSQQSDAMQRMREGGGKPGLARMEQLAGKSGREILEAMMSGELPYPPMNETMNMTLLAVENGRAVFQGIPLPQQIATAEARVEDETGKLYAHATTTCFVFDVPTA